MKASCVQFLLERGDIDAASLRAVTLASVPDLKLQTLGKPGRRMEEDDQVERAADPRRHDRAPTMPSTIPTAW